MREFLKKKYVVEILKEFKDSVLNEVINYYSIDMDIVDTMEKDLEVIFKSIIEKHNLKGDE